MPKSSASVSAVFGLFDEIVVDVAAKDLRKKDERVANDLTKHQLRMLSMTTILIRVNYEFRVDDVAKFTASSASNCCHSNLLHRTLEADGRLIVAQNGRLPLHQRHIRTSFRAKLDYKMTRIARIFVFPFDTYELMTTFSCLGVAGC